jgi:hypothetical protein
VACLILPSTLICIISFDSHSTGRVLYLITFNLCTWVVVLEMWFPGQYINITWELDRSSVYSDIYIYQNIYQNAFPHHEVFKSLGHWGRGILPTKLSFQLKRTSIVFATFIHLLFAIFLQGIVPSSFALK